MREVEVFTFKFRPSSHSDDFTIIATYKDAKKAGKVHKKLKELLEDMEEHPDNHEGDWSADDAYCCASGNTVRFEVNTDGCLDKVEAIMKPESTDYGVYTDYQELTITVEVPKGLTLEAAMLVLPEEEAEALRELKAWCGEPIVGDIDEQTSRFIFDYTGDSIYSEIEDTLYVGGITLELAERGNWKVDME